VVNATRKVNKLSGLSMTMEKSWVMMIHRTDNYGTQRVKGGLFHK